MRIKLFEEFSEWDRDDFLLDLFTMSSTEVENLFFEEIKKSKPHIEKIEVMLESGLVDVNAKGEGGWTPLHLATRWNCIETAKLLLEMGVDLEAKDNWGWTPLHLASANNSIKVAELLLDRGAEKNAIDDEGKTPLHWATIERKIEMIELLLDRGAVLGIKDKSGRTPLDLAYSYEMKALLGGGL
jgi:ankyrin repeat protein